jgi:hypothetical protein
MVLEVWIIANPAAAVRMRREGSASHQRSFRFLHLPVGCRLLTIFSSRLQRLPATLPHDLPRGGQGVIQPLLSSSEEGEIP